MHTLELKIKSYCNMLKPTGTTERVSLIVWYFIVTKSNNHFITIRQQFLFTDPFNIDRF